MSAVCVKVVELGLARVTEWKGTKGSELTQLGGVAGTVDYMSPEQAENPLGVDARSDIYSLGCTLFALLTGGPVFNKSSLVGRLLAHRVVPPPMLSAVRSDAPAALDAIFQRMLAQSPDDRFASMEKVVAALDALNRPQVAAETMQLFSKAVEQAWAPDRATVLVVEESRCRPA